MKKLYCISGLGADQRAFSRLRVDGYELQALPWLEPLPKESLTDYAARMKDQLQENDPVLMGLSFGGIMSIEIAKLLPNSKVILISSVSSTSQLPNWMKLCGKLRLNRIAPVRNGKFFEPIQNYNLGVTTPEEIELVRYYRKHTSQKLLNWSIDKILNWKNDWQPSRFFHIHGDIDRMFSIKKVQPTHTISGGGHFMIMNKSGEINKVLKEIFAN